MPVKKSRVSKKNVKAEPKKAVKKTSVSAAKKSVKKTAAKIETKAIVKKAAIKKSKNKFTVAVVGATGLVGKTFLKLIEKRKFPIDKLYLFASERSKGLKLECMGKKYEVLDINECEKYNYDIAFFSAGSQVSLDYAHKFIDRGALVVDNSAAFRMHPNVPLVVPEVNMEDGLSNMGLIANPNCSTIQMVVALWPLHKAFGIKRIVVTTFQSVSGTGTAAIDELKGQVSEILERGVEKSYEHGLTKNVYPHQIAFNCLPHIDKFQEDGYTFEEVKMINETRKIFNEPKMKVTATTVRVPVFRGHSESVNIEFKNPVTADEVTAILKYAPGVKLIDDVKQNSYPMPVFCEDRDEVFVGRIREDKSVKYGINLWVVSDNILKGAALNGIQIVEEYFNIKK